MTSKKKAVFVRSVGSIVSMWKKFLMKNNI